MRVPIKEFLKKDVPVDWIEWIVAAYPLHYPGKIFIPIKVWSGFKYTPLANISAVLQWEQEGSLYKIITTYHGLKYGLSLNLRAETTLALRTYYPGIIIHV